MSQMLAKLLTKERQMKKLETTLIGLYPLDLLPSNVTHKCITSSFSRFRFFKTFFHKPFERTFSTPLKKSRSKQMKWFSRILSQKQLQNTPEYCFLFYSLQIMSLSFFHIKLQFYELALYKIRSRHFLSELTDHRSEERKKKRVKYWFPWKHLKTSPINSLSVATFKRFNISLRLAFLMEAATNFHLIFAYARFEQADDPAVLPPPRPLPSAHFPMPIHTMVEKGSATRFFFSTNIIIGLKVGVPFF